MPEKKVMTPKQIRARARRAGGLGHITKDEQKALMTKPLEDWDLEELAKGRPKAKDGTFKGAHPGWITRETHEKIVDLFKDRVRTDMRSLTVKALDVFERILDDEEVDEKGRPMIAAGTKVDAAKFLIEHLVGKPTQPIQGEFNVRLQALLGNVLVQPAELGGGTYEASSSHRIVEGTVVEDDEEAEE